MAVDDDDLGDVGGLGFADLVVASKAQHMLGVTLAAAIARHRLDREKRLPSLAAQPLDDLDGGNIDVAFRTAVVRFLCENRGDVRAQRIVVERRAARDLVRATSEPGGELMIHDYSFSQSTAGRWPRHQPCLRGEQPGARGAAKIRRGGAGALSAAREPRPG